MTAPVWPAGLPQYFLAEGYNEGLPDNVQRSQPSVGPAKTRRRTTSMPWPVTGTMRMTVEQYEEFEAFVRGDLSEGARAFSLPKQRGAAGVWLVRFAEAPSSAYVAPFFEVALKLEVLP